MDPFEVRMQFLSLLQRLTSSLASIHRVSSFALKYGPKCGDDIWDCLVEECAHLNLNARINLLYFLDTLLDKQAPGQPYKNLVRRDLAKVVDLVVPKTREGVLNLMSAHQVLRSWKTRRLLDASILDAISADLETRRVSALTTIEESESSEDAFSSFSRKDILRRIEDDRERHKRLRERIWVLPVPTTIFPTAPLHASHPAGLYGALGTANTSGTSSNKTSPTSPTSPSSPAEPPQSDIRFAKKLRTSASTSLSVGPSTATDGLIRGPEVPIEIEFDQLWEANEDEMQSIPLAALDTSSVVDEEKETDARQSKVGFSLTTKSVKALQRESSSCFV